MKKPIIGITPQLGESGDIISRPHYMDCVLRAGGIPVILPFTRDVSQIAEFCDGFLLSGGPDFHPHLFGEEKLPCCGNISPRRDEFELRLIPAVLESKKPILGICRGVQALNVALGGTLYQDLPTQKPSSVCHRMTVVSSEVIHSIDIVDGSPLKALLGCEKTMVNSYHHQSIKATGDGLEIMALAEDGVIEGVYLKDHPFCLGLQWHPERLENEDTTRIFGALIHACK